MCFTLLVYNVLALVHTVQQVLQDWNKAINLGSNAIEDYIIEQQS